MNQKRKEVVKLLKSKHKDAKLIEQSIYDMCKIFAEEDETPLARVYSYYMYQFSAELIEGDMKDKEKVLEDIKEQRVDWNSSFFNEIREKEKQLTALEIEGIKIVKGEFTCRNKKCLSKECFMRQVQTRSGDEGMTTYITCTKCRTRYKFN